MRHLFLILTLVAGLSGPVAAQNADIEATIGAQMEAFRADDVGQAFTYASPSIQQFFGTAENFGGMVRQGYPMVWRSTDVRFLELSEIAGNIWQKVEVTDAAGRVHLLAYQMIELDGRWRINAVQVLEATALST